MIKTTQTMTLSFRCQHRLPLVTLAQLMKIAIEGSGQPYS